MRRILSVWLPHWPITRLNHGASASPDRPLVTIEAIRGVRNRETLRTLLKRKIIAPAGRARTRGHPVQYKTTRRFLVEFGLQSLDELPSLVELKPKAAFPLDLESA